MPKSITCILFSSCIFLLSCNSNNTFILKSQKDTGLVIGDPILKDLDSIGCIENIQTKNGEVFYKVVVERKFGLKKNSRLVLDYSLMNGDPYLRIRNTGFGERLSIKDTIRIDTAAKKKLTIEKIFNELADSLKAQQKNALDTAIINKSN